MDVVRQIFISSLSPRLWWAVLNQLILSAGAVVIIVVLSNVLDAQTFGRARFLAAVLAIFAFFSLPGIGPVLLQQIPIYSRRGFTGALRVQLRWGSGAAAGALVFAFVFWLKEDFDLAAAFAIAGLLAPIANLYLMPGLALAGLQKYKQKTLFDGVIISAVAFGAWYGAHITGTVSGTMAWYFGIQSVATLAGLYLVRRELAPTSEVVIDADADARFGKQLTLIQLPFTLLPALEKVLIFLLLGPTALAVYVVALLPIEHFRSAYRSMVQFFILPQLRNATDMTAAVWHWMRTAVLLGVGGALVIVGFTLTIFPIIFAEFTGVQVHMLWTAIIALSLPTHVCIVALLARRRVERLYEYAIISVLLDVLTFVVLTALFGLPGAVAAKVGAAFVTAVLAVGLYRMDTKQK